MLRRSFNRCIISQHGCEVGSVWDCEGGGMEGGYVLMFVNGEVVVMVGCSEEKKTTKKT